MSGLTLRRLSAPTTRRNGGNARRPAQASLERRIVLASNRAPYVRRESGEWEQSPGGLVSALAPTMHKLGGTWVAAGEPGLPAHGRIPNEDSYHVRLVPLTERDEEGYYLGYANRVLWPSCHLRLDRVQFRKSHWQTYQEVNERFAEAVADEAARAPSAVWLHDYHLALVPRMLRGRLPEPTPVSFFWHVPWPSAYVFKANPTRRALLEGLLGADIVGLQTRLFVRNFLACCAEELGDRARIQDDRVEYEGHTTRVMHLPIGIDTKRCAREAATASVKQKADGIRRRYAPRPGMKIGLGVDRLDYSKGILRRLQAIEAFFDRYPKYRRRFTFVQISNPSRTRIPAYAEYRTDVLSRVEDINGRIGEYGWNPIELVSARQDHEELFAHYRAADVLVVTSVADGMNLVAKEFVACQADERGALLLSEMAGASEELVDATLINPFDIDGIAQALYEALEAPPAQKRERLRRMRAHLETYSIQRWIDDNLRAMKESLEETPDRRGPA